MVCFLILVPGDDASPIYICRRLPMNACADWMDTPPVLTHAKMERAGAHRFSISRALVDTILRQRQEGGSSSLVRTSDSFEVLLHWQL